MKTTEVFIEQILIGFLVLAIGSLPFYSTILGLLSKQESVGRALGFGAASVGIAYLCGVVFDRYADWYLTLFEKHIRARFAIACMNDSTKNEKSMPGGGDPFPEDRLRTQALRAEAGVQDWLHYLRSAIRLTRALVMFVPGLTLSAVIASLREPNEEVLSWTGYDTAMLWTGCIAIAVAYFAMPLSTLVCGKLGRYFRGDYIPKTYAIDLLRGYGSDRSLCKDAKGQEPTGSKRTWFSDITYSPQFAAGVVISISALLVIGIGAHWGQQWSGVPVVIILVGCTLTWLAAQAWEKVLTTYMRFLRLLDAFPRQGP